LVIGKSGRSGCLALRDQDEVKSAGKIVLRKSKRLAQTTLDDRPNDRLSNFPRNAHSETGSTQVVLGRVNKQKTVARSRPFLEDAGKIARRFHPTTSRKGVLLHGVDRSSESCPVSFWFNRSTGLPWATVEGLFFKYQKGSGTLEVGSSRRAA